MILCTEKFFLKKSGFEHWNLTFYSIWSEILKQWVKTGFLPRGAQGAAPGLYENSVH